MPFPVGVAHAIVNCYHSCLGFAVQRQDPLLTEADIDELNLALLKQDWLLFPVQSVEQLIRVLMLIQANAKIAPYVNCGHSSVTPPSPFSTNGGTNLIARRRAL